MTRSPGRSVDRIDTDTERTPLLAGTPTPTASTSTRSLSPNTTITNDDDNDDNDAAATANPNHPLTHLRAVLRPRVILLSMFLIFLLELAIGMYLPPANAIMESIICRQMHPDVFLPPSPPSLSPSPSPNLTTISTISTISTTVPSMRHYAGGIVLVDDPACKQPDVQGYLAMLRGWGMTFDCLPGIVGAVPYGILSDRWGRRPVLGLGVVGLVGSLGFNLLVFYFSDVVPLWATWLSSGFQLIGGGGTIVVAMFYTAVADVVPSAERATVFFQLAGVFLASQMIAGPLGGAMLIWNPWIPLLVALAVLVIANLGVLAFPETVHVHDRKETEEEQEQEEDGDGVSRTAKLWQKTRVGLAGVWDFVLGNKRLAFLMVSLTFVVFGRFVGELLLQYATDRYGWSWSTASMVLTIRNGGSLVTLLAVLPVMSWFCTRRLDMAVVAKDLWLARWSGVVQIVGSLTIAAAANGSLFSIGLVWYALGSGMSSLIRSLLNALVEEHHVGTVNSLVGFMETVGMTMAGPLLAKSLSIGLNLGGAWIGLPFITAGLFFIVATAILWMFGLPNERRISVEPSC
ncbi:major facilitator superfamily domain-containing protein [Chaetomidium leptoderma]|uniref:Major facilitator superfamily domain-containing protein n=1 Tax=Chaetomidium leptoderma TaxID=669021 RepID=A0AAN6VUL7_9PEZI|nr:major facilitator superfamily domain-containing protein [Chaetomidium leptoderma]